MTGETTSAHVPERDRQAEEDLWQRYKAERGVWTEPMLAALAGGMKDKKWFSLADKIQSDRTLGLAWEKVRANAGVCGVDGITVERFAKDSQARLLAVKEHLRGGSYQPKPVKRKWIPKAGSAEKRPLGIPTVTDRVVQAAVKMGIEPVFESRFHPGSHGFRPGRGCKDALREVQNRLEAGALFVVDVDIKGYFDTIPHDRLLARVRERIADGKVLGWIEGFLKQGVMEGTDWQAAKEGTPQGGVISPLLANIYLDPLDKELEKRGLSFVRYADDIAIFVSSERSARRVLESVTEWIERHLKVPVNRDKSGARRTDESSLLGFRLYADGRVGVAPKAVERMKDRVRELWDAQRSVPLNELRMEWGRYIQGWWNYFRLADWRREVENLSGWIRRHMRKWFWLRWKTVRGRYNALREHGVKGRSLGNARSSRGAWPMACHRAMNQALKNKVLLEKYELIIPWALAEASD